MKKINFKKENGITLIALIITIIIMLILVSVSINILIKSDLFGVAQNAADKTKTAYEEEGKLSEITIGDKTYSSIEEYLNKDDGGLPKVVAGQKASENSEYSDGKNTAVIPAGFTVSKVKTDTVNETTIEGGLVIYLIDDKTEKEISEIDWTDGETVANLQKTYDQFVWIPIKNTTDENAQDINDMYICQGKTADNGTCTIVVENGIAKCTNEAHSSEENGVNKNTQMAGYLYSNTAMTTRYETYTEGTFSREPDTVSSCDGDSTYLGYLSDILEASVETDKKEYTSIEKFKAKLQEEYNEIVKSVYKNQGFYVGRYETSGMKQATTGYEVAVVAGAIPSNYIDWYHMYAEQVNYAKDKNLDLASVGSTMIQGAAYDQVMKFVNTAEYSVTTTGNVGHTDSNFTTYPYQTGGLDYNTNYSNYEAEPYKDVSKNIFDLEGNVKAWTTEESFTGSRVVRGGSFLGSGSANSRNESEPDVSGYLECRFLGPALRKMKFYVNVGLSANSDALSACVPEVAL